ncbi:MAG: hypothetical protein ACYDA6_05715 [Solirubrobacteraceae bacterium]
MKSLALMNTVITIGSLLAFGCAGADAEGTTPATALRTVSVQGVAQVPIAQGSDALSATASYRQAMAAAVADGHGKAEYLASKAGASVGAVQNVTEEGGSISCTGGQESNYVEYSGEMPDFGYTSGPGGPIVVGRSAPAATTGAPAPPKRLRPVPAKKHRSPKRRKGSHAKKAAAVSCTIRAAVSLAYLLS